MSDIQVIKSDGKREPFDEKKLAASIVWAGSTQVAAEAIAREIESNIKTATVHSSELYDATQDLIRNTERRVLARYSVRKAIAELGPTGFPFEKFVSEIFYARGYKVLTDQIMKGACAEHEVDVVAYNDTELIVCEVKFHNTPGLKSDLKVALYVKARHDDLKEVTHMIAGKERKFTDGWLITNTKFTQAAIGYAMCEHLTLVGWNYPTTQNLEDMIAKHALYPVTCLLSIESVTKHALIEKGIVLVKQISENPALLESFMPKTQIQHVIDEITILFSTPAPQ